MQPILDDTAVRRVSVAEAIGPLFRGAVSSPEASFEAMAGWRAIESAIGEKDLAALRAIARSRMEPASRSSEGGCWWPTRKTRRFLRWGGAVGAAPSRLRYSPMTK